jgi:hypothetical protein
MEAARAICKNGQAGFAAWQKGSNRCVNLDVPLYGGNGFSVLQ